MRGLIKSTIFYKRKLLVILFCLIIGLITGFNTSEYNISESLLNIETRAFSGSFLGVFSKILTNNMLVSFIISVLGYFTAGILSCIVLFFNGLILGDLVNLLLEINISIWDKIKLLFIHGPLELIAFILFSMIGLNGFMLFKGIYSNKNIKLNNLPRFKLSDFLLPSALLTIAAFIESFIIVTQ